MIGTFKKTGKWIDFYEVGGCPWQNIYTVTAFNARTGEHRGYREGKELPRTKGQTTKGEWKVHIEASVNSVVSCTLTVASASVKSSATPPVGSRRPSRLRKWKFKPSLKPLERSGHIEGASNHL